MTEIFNIYCDESCHLENDGQRAMVLGAVWCPEAKRLEVAERLREIKARHKGPNDKTCKEHLCNTPNSPWPASWIAA